jgi:hypothetical protein
MTDDELAAIEAGNKRRLGEKRLPERWMYSVEAIRGACFEIDALAKEVRRLRVENANLRHDKGQMCQPSCWPIGLEPRREADDD